MPLATDGDREKSTAPNAALQNRMESDQTHFALFFIVFPSEEAQEALSVIENVHLSTLLSGQVPARSSVPF